MRKAIDALFGDLDPFGKFWLWLGLGSLAAAAAMSADFGLSVSIKHALFLGVLSIVAAFGPMAAERLWGLGRRGPAIAAAMICVPLLGIEFYSHAGYTAGLRGQNISEARVQNMRFDGAQDAVSDDKANVALWRKQLATLLEQNAWAGTVKADGLKGELKTLLDRIEDEKKGTRGRKPGCGKECERLQNEASALSARIATAEQATDLTSRIEATQRILDGKREVATKTEHKSSAVEHQNEFLAKAVALVSSASLKPTEFQSESAQQTVNLAMAVAGTGLPAFALFMAGLFRVRRRDEIDTPHTTPVSEVGNRTPDARAYPSQLALRTTTIAALRQMQAA